MKNLSLIIKSCSEQLNNYINDLEPLVDDFSTELILINNEIEKMNIPYKYIIYKYEESYGHLVDFCNSICTRENIIIVEDGMLLNREIVEIIKSELLNNSTNIYCNVKRFLSKDKDKFVIDELKICYSNVGDSKVHINNTIEDMSLLQNTYECIDKGITLLCSNESFDALYLWYSLFILQSNTDLLQKFYELIEKRKNEATLNEIKSIEKLFLNSKADDRYSRYLNIKNNYYCENISDITKIKNEVNSLYLRSEDKFFCYFLLGLIKNPEAFTEICNVISLKVLQSYFEFLFSHEKDFYLYLYEYLISINLENEISIKNNNRIDLYLNISKFYIQYISSESDSLENKQKLIQVFVDYTNYGFYIINQRKPQGNKLIFNPENKFLHDIDRAINFINKGSLEKALLILENAANSFPIMSRPVEYYIQRLRLENKAYPYKISICMIVKDEEKNIERCLKSLKPLVDVGLAEFVVVDTGSTDKTVEIAQKYVNRLFFHEWQGSFSEARNYNISLAQGEYIFIMDADEEIESNELKKIIDVFNSAYYSNYNTFSFKIKNYSDEKYKKFSIFTQNLIFKNDGTFYYSGSVHNQPIYKHPIKHLDCIILHYGYIMTADIKDKKFNRTATLLKKELEKNPSSIYYRFQLSVSYSMHGDLKEALEQVKIYMKSLKDKKASTSENLMYYNNAALVYANNLLYDEAIEICDEALVIQPDFIDFIFYKGYGLFEKKEYKEAIIFLKEYLLLIDEFGNHEVMHDDRYLFYTLDSKEIALSMLTVAYNKAGQYEECIEQSENIKDNSVFKNTIYTVIDSYIKLRNYDGIACFYESKIYNYIDTEVKEVFKYFLEEQLANIPEDEQKKCIISLANSDLADDYIDVYRFRAGKDISQNAHRVLSFIDKYDINETDSISGNMIIETIIPIVMNYNYKSNIDVFEIKNLKRSAEFILHRSINLKQYCDLSKNDLLQILDKYISSCAHLISIEKEDLLENYEVLFISNVLNAFEELNRNNLVKCIGYIRDSVLVHKKMAKPIEMFLETIVPGYLRNENDFENLNI